jgi:hypothetical protein
MVGENSRARGLDRSQGQICLVPVGATVVLVGVAYITGRARAGRLAGCSMNVVLSTEVREGMRERKEARRGGPPSSLGYGTSFPGPA